MNNLPHLILINSLYAVGFDRVFDRLWDHAHNMQRQQVSLIQYCKAR